MGNTKKIIILCILEILNRYTDFEHRLGQKDIIELLKKDYGMSVDRKAVKRNIESLIDFGFDIAYEERLRYMSNPGTGKSEEYRSMTGLYLVRDFTDSELNLLISELRFSKFIPYGQSKELIEKLTKLSSRYFCPNIEELERTTGNSPKNSQFFLNMEILSEAILKKKKVRFKYNEYGTDKKLHARLNAEGNPREYIINPYEIVSANDRYYLICNYEHFEQLSHYRIDRITEAEILEEDSKPISQIKGLSRDFDLSWYMPEHIYMYTGKGEKVSFRMKKSFLNKAIDWFGNRIEFSGETEREVTASVEVNFDDMRKWALQYAMDVRILSPQKLVNAVRADLEEALGRY